MDIFGRETMEARMGIKKSAGGNTRTPSKRSLVGGFASSMERDAATGPFVVYKKPRRSALGYERLGVPTRVRVSTKSAVARIKERREISASLDRIEARSKKTSEAVSRLLSRLS